ncbi:unnamed protein product [marine sediment metagenome]|uniref:Uncharacterized protein n=1 Tax=marine sediment metagenome TaxID=412755 RepID=X1UJA9_9ZZZZ
MIKDDGDKISHTVKNYIDSRDDTIQGIIGKDRKNQDFKLKAYRTEVLVSVGELNKANLRFIKRLGWLVVLLSFVCCLLSASQIFHLYEHSQHKEVKK